MLGFIPAFLSGQNLDPTVNVSGTYHAKQVEVHKPTFKMQVPDSLEQFELKFDYSIFDAPYMGAYEFKPYLLNIKPSSSYDSSKSFYLNLGAGYSLYPELDVVYSPKLGRKFRLSVYGHHNSYFGGYRGVGLFENDGNNIVDISNQRGYKGYNSSSRAGVNGSYDWKSGVIYLDLSYLGVAAKDSSMVRSMDGANLSLGLMSREKKKDHIFYHAHFDYSYLEDKIKLANTPKKYLGEHKIAASADLGYSFKYSQKVLLDIDFDLYKYSSLFDNLLGNIAFTPKYEYKKNRWNLELGLEFAMFIKDNALILDDLRGQIIYPDIRANYAVIKDHLNLFVNAVGGNRVNSYSSFVNKNNHFTSLYSMPSAMLLDNSVERINICAGINGNIATKFKYMLKGGYANLANAPIDALNSGKTLPLIPSMQNGELAPLMSYASYQMTYASLALKWDSQDLNVSSDFIYRNTNLLNYEKVVGFAPSKFAANLSATYNWNKRIYVGMDCDFMSSREGRIYADSVIDAFPIYELPYFVDLDLRAEYKFNNSLSFWLRGSNLLNMPIIYNPAVVENGINFTLGVCYNL